MSAKDYSFTAPLHTDTTHIDLSKLHIYLWFEYYNTTYAKFCCFCFVCLFFKPAGHVVISNDGATILKTLDIVHPAAKTLVDIAKSQDSEVTIKRTFSVIFFNLVTANCGVH